MSIQKQFWLSQLLLRQPLPNGGETVSLLCGIGEDPLHIHPKRHKLFSGTHQSLRKNNNSDHLERGLKSSNLKCCNQAISVLNKSGLQLPLQEVLHLIGAIRWNTILHGCEIFVWIHCFNSRMKSSRRCFR